MVRTSSDASVTIANGASLSSAVLLGKTLVMIVMPSAWDAANLTFQVSIDNGVTYNNLYDDAGTELTVTAAASRAIAVDPSQFAGAKYLKVRSGTSGVPVNQTAARTIVLAVAPILG